MITAYIDGGCAPINPGGIGAWGIVLYRDGEELWTEGKVCGKGPQMSNNVAEYYALLALLDWCEKFGIPKDETVEILSDSMLLVQQMSGKWGIKKGLYVPLAREALSRLLPSHIFKWIPREKNEADAQVREAHKRIEESV